MNEFEVKRGMEECIGRGGVEVGMNEREFVISIGLEEEEFMGEVLRERVNLNKRSIIADGDRDEMLKAESDVSGGLNYGLDDLRDVFIFLSEQMVAKNGLLEFGKSQRICNKGLASIEIDGDAIDGEAFQIMKSQMRDGREHREYGAEVFDDGVIPMFASHDGEVQFRHVEMKINEEASINFASTQYVTGFAWHPAGMIFAHPLQIVRIVSASFKLASVPGP